MLKFFGREKPEEKREAEAKIILEKIINIKNEIFLKNDATLGDFKNLIKEQNELRNYGPYLQNYNRENRNKEENLKVNDLLIAVVSFEDLFLEYTSHIYTSYGSGQGSEYSSEVNPDELELDNVKKKKPLYEQIYFYKTRYNDDTSYKYEFELHDAIKKETEKLKEMNGDGKKYENERKEFIKKKKTEYENERKKLNNENELEIKKFTSEEDKKIIREIKDRPLYEQIKLYNDHIILNPEDQTYSNRFDNLINIAKKMEQNLINVQLYDDNNPNEKYINDKKIFQEEEETKLLSKEINEGVIKEFNNLTDEQKNELEKIKKKPLYEQIYFYNTFWTYESDINDDRRVGGRLSGSYLSGGGNIYEYHLKRAEQDEKEKLKNMKAVDKEDYLGKRKAYIETKEEEKKELLEKAAGIKNKEKSDEERKERACKEYLEKNIFTYHNISPPLNLFYSIKDELSQILKQQFENLSETNNKIQEYLRENKIKGIKDINKIDPFDCIYLYDLIFEI